MSDVKGLSYRPRFFSQLTEPNQDAIEQFIEHLLSFQEKKYSGQLLMFINNGGNGHKIIPSPSIEVRTRIRSRN